MNRKLVESVIVIPDKENTVRMTDENFLALLTENKLLRDKNSELNKIIKKMLDEKQKTI